MVRRKEYIFLRCMKMRWWYLWILFLLIILYSVFVMFCFWKVSFKVDVLEKIRVGIIIRIEIMIVMVMDICF